MNLDQFKLIVDQTVKDLPEEFKSKMENVDVMVEIWPTQDQLRSIYAHPGTILYGLYRGIPKTKRGDNYSNTLPDKIIIFAGPIISMSPTIEAVETQIRKTVLHEIGHHFGMSEEAIRAAQG